MSKQKQRQAAHEKGMVQEAGAAAPINVDVNVEIAIDMPHKPRASFFRLLPLPLWLLFALFLVVGLAIGLSRDARMRSSAYTTLANCNATVIAEMDGLNDSYGIVQFNQHSDDVVNWLSLCEREPEAARSVFRRALDDGNKSARVLALYSAFYLTSRGQLKQEDFERIRQRLDPEKEKELDVRKAAHRALSDLTIILQPGQPAGQKSKYEAVPSGVPLLPGVSGAHKIQTREEQHAKMPVLGVRWSSVELARAWLKLHEADGKWDEQLQRYVVGSKP